MNDQTPRKGDKALIKPGAVQDTHGYVLPPRGCVGTLRRMIFDVLSDPVLAQDHWSDWVKQVTLVDAPCGCKAYLPTSQLIRIPPDSEAKHLFAETEVERSVKA